MLVNPSWTQGKSSGLDTGVGVGPGVGVGTAVGVGVGAAVGATVGSGVGVGATVGATVGSGVDVGATVGAMVGAGVGVGATVGATVGAGVSVGTGLGAGAAAVWRTIEVGSASLDAVGAAGGLVSAPQAITSMVNTPISKLARSVLKFLSMIPVGLPGRSQDSRIRSPARCSARNLSGKWRWPASVHTRDFPYWQSPGPQGSPKEMLAAYSGAAKHVSRRSIQYGMSMQSQSTVERGEVGLRVVG